MQGNPITASVSIKRSEAESRHSGLEIGRVDTSFFHQENFPEQFAKGQYDVMRCKIISDDRAAIEALEHCGIFYLEANPILQYEMTFPYTYERSFTHSEVVYKKASISDKEEVAQIIAATMAEEPIGYFRVSFLESLISADMEIAMLQTFYENYLGQDDQKQIILLRRDSKCLGFIAYDLLPDQNTLYCPLAGILPEERSTGLFNDIGRYTFRYADDLGFKHFMTGAREHNLKSRKAFEKEGLQFKHRERLFHLMPFLHYQQPEMHGEWKFEQAHISCGDKKFQITNHHQCSIAGNFSSLQAKVQLLTAHDDSAFISHLQTTSSALILRQYCCKASL